MSKKKITFDEWLDTLVGTTMIWHLQTKYNAIEARKLLLKQYKQVRKPNMKRWLKMKSGLNAMYFADVKLLKGVKRNTYLTSMYKEFLDAR